MVCQSNASRCKRIPPCKASQEAWVVSWFSLSNEHQMHVLNLKLGGEGCGKVRCGYEGTLRTVHSKMCLNWNKFHHREEHSWGRPIFAFFIIHLPDKHQKMQTLHQIQTAFQEYLNKQDFGKDPESLYQPVRYIMSLGGKRLRPLVLLLCHKLFKENIAPAMPAALAIEIFHNFTLVHDDIMDEAPLRRGKPTVHHKFNTNKAILSGDVMLVMAYDYLLQLENNSLIPAISKIFTKTAIEVCEGQQMDMDFEKRMDVSVEEYLRMIELKTSVLVAAAMKIGALTGGAQEQDAQRLYEFGRNIGMAFQLQDDLLDSFGDPQKVGKQPGGDILQNKKTYLFLKSLELADDKTKAELIRWYRTTNCEEEKKIARVKSIFTSLDVPSQTEALKATFENKALQQLQGIQAPKNRIVWLSAFAESLMKREF